MSKTKPCQCCGNRRTSRRATCGECGRAVCVSCWVIELEGMKPLCLACEGRLVLFSSEPRVRGMEVRHCDRDERGTCHLGADAVRRRAQPGCPAGGQLRGRVAGAGEAALLPGQGQPLAFGQVSGVHGPRLGGGPDGARTIRDGAAGAVEERAGSLGRAGRPRQRRRFTCLMNGGTYVKRRS